MHQTTRTNQFWDNNFETTTKTENKTNPTLFFQNKPTLKPKQPKTKTPERRKERED